MRFEIEFSPDGIRQTGGLREVISFNTVFYFDIHKNSIKSPFN